MATDQGRGLNGTHGRVTQSTTRITCTEGLIAVQGPPLLGTTVWLRVGESCVVPPGMVSVRNVAAGGNPPSRYRWEEVEASDGPA